MTVLPVLARKCPLPDVLGLRAPTDFTRSYEEGFKGLMARLSAPTTSIKAAPSASAMASNQVAAELRRFLAKHPEELSKLSPRKFEELIASLLSESGLDVELTAQSRDGGVDIVAVGGRDTKDVPILIQCKRYAGQRRVGVEAVRALFGAALLHEVGHAMLVTTSSFTHEAVREAKQFTDQSRDRWKLELVDAERLVSWLAATPDLDPDVTMPVEQVHQRYGRLIDKKFVASLSQAEERELARLERALDQAEAPLYEPLKRVLLAERERLKARRKE